MISFTAHKKVAAVFVADLLMTFAPSSLSITIITRGSSEACSVYIATDTSLEDIVKNKALNFFEQHTNTSFEIIQDG